MPTPYEEHRNVPWRWALYGPAILIAVGAGVSALDVPEAQDLGPVGSWLVPSLLALLAVAMAVVGRVFSTYHVRCDDQSLRFGYRGVAKDLLLDRIAWADATDVSWPRWGGMGWRIDWKGRIGYVFGSGPGVELRADGRTYVFNCAAPAELLERLHRADVAPRERN